MHLMLVNDDGIHAPGIRALCDAAVAAGHRVSVCAPDRERSGASHSLTFGRPLKAKKVDFPGAEIAYAADGTPTDCARLGLYLIPDVDIVVSGINNGPNLGGACIYSGTVGSAAEASMSGTPALAVSYCGFYHAKTTESNAYPTGAEAEHQGQPLSDYDASARIAMQVVEWMVKNPLPRGDIYSLNVPARLTYEEVKGVRAAKLAPSYLDSPVYLPVETEDGVGYDYRHGADALPLDDPEGDIALTRVGYATLTRLTWNLRAGAPDPDVSDIEL